MSIKRARRYLQKKTYEASVLFDLPNHREFLKFLTGIDCFIDMENAVSEAIYKLDVDILAFGIPKTPENKAELENDPNLYGTAATHWRNEETTLSDVFSHDPLKLRPHLNDTDDAIINMLLTEDMRCRKYCGCSALSPGGFFTTCVHYAAEDLNYEEFLCACLLEPDRVSGLFDSYEALSTRVLAAWRRCNIEMMVCHDDIANSKSLTFSPKFIRQHILPRYKRLFTPFIESEIPLFYMTDGNFIEVAKDISDIGVDGFFVDRPSMDLSSLIKLCGEDKFYFTGPTPEIMTNGSEDKIKYEMDMLKEIAVNVPGLMYHLPGGWTQNMSLENVKTYYKCLNRL